MKPQRSESTTCHLFPEMVDVGMGQLAEEEDLRAAVAEARRVAELNGQNKARASARPQAPSWPVEPGSLAEAVYWYRQTAGLGDAIQPDEVAASLCNLGYAWRDQRRWAEAETAFHESLQLRRQHRDRAGEGQTLLDLGHLYQAQGRWRDAEPAFGQSLAIAREAGNRRSEAAALGNLGVTCAALGKTEKAVGYLEQALALAREMGDDAFKQRMLEHLARISPCS
jgi:tetratricopeptide (TPR) repeat protein